MDLSSLQANWDAFGSQDPLRAILTAPEMADSEWRLEEFFETGRLQVAQAMRAVRSLRPELGRDRALDFGCGVGRLTQGLCHYFAHCDGVDIAASMIREARAHNRFGEQCRYRVNPSDNLELFDDDTFDFVYSMLVLQHCRAEYSERYIEEFFRILKPEGMVIFQLAGDVVPPGSTWPPGGTRIDELLAPGALLARIEPLGVLGADAAKLTAGKQVRTTVAVKNAGPAAWPPRGDGSGKYQIKLRHRWQDERGRPAGPEGSATLLPHAVEPGDQVELRLILAVPTEPGRYSLDLYVAQEGVARDENRSAQAKRCAVEVVDDSVDDRAGRPEMEMHGIARARVLELVDASGGRVLKVGNARATGPLWTSYTYFATRDR